MVGQQAKHVDVILILMEQFLYLCDVLYAVESGGLLCGRLAALVGSHGHGGAPDTPKLGLSALDKKVQSSRMMSPGACYRGLKQL